MRAARFDRRRPVSSLLPGNQDAVGINSWPISKWPRQLSPATWFCRWPTISAAICDLAVYNAQTGGNVSCQSSRLRVSFGNLKSQTNAAVDCLFGFTGLPFDKGSGTNRSETRPYDPITGRWFTEDMLGFRGNESDPSRFCRNSPTNLTDPLGQDDGLDALFWGEFPDGYDPEERASSGLPPLGVDGDDAAPHVRFETGQRWTWFPGISHLNNQNLLTRIQDSLERRSTWTAISEHQHGSVVSNLYSGGDSAAMASSYGRRRGSGGLCHGPSAGTSTSPASYHITLKANGKGEADATITEGATAVLEASVNGSAYCGYIG